MNFKLKLSAWVFLGACFFVSQAGASLVTKYPDQKFITAPTGYVQSNVEKATFEEKLKTLVDKASGGRGVLDEFYKGPEGMTLVVVSGALSNGKKALGWVPPGANLLMFGEVITRDGKKLSKELDRDKIIGADNKSKDPEVSKEEKKKIISELSTIVQYPEMENPVNTLYVYLSMTCPHCKNLLTDVQEVSNFKDEKIQIEWIPVGFDSKTKNKVANIYKSDNSLDMLQRHYNKGLSNVKEIEDKELLNKIKEDSMSAFKINGKPGFPMLVFEKDGKLEAHSGAPSKSSFDSLIKHLK